MKLPENLKQAFLKPRLKQALLSGLSLYLLATLLFVARYEFNPSAMVRFGLVYAGQNESYTPEGSIVFIGDEAHGGNGYDGQIFYYYARTLFEKNYWPEGFSRAYRAPRIGYPLLAAPFSLAGSWSTIAGLILTQLVLFSISIRMLFSYLPEGRRHLIYFYIASPFALQSYLLLVSDGVVASLLIVGCVLFLQNLEAMRHSLPALLLAFCAFSVALLTKESALFLMFPLGLLALARRRALLIIMMAATLLPFLAWQYYLREAHGMVPASILAIFLKPLDGIWHTLLETGNLLRSLFQMNLSAIVPLAKISARLFLIALIVLASYAVARPSRKGGLLSGWHFRMAILFTLVSVLIADYYYFWSVYENISRMLTLLVPLMIFLHADEGQPSARLFFRTLLALALFVLLRIAFLTPAFPYIKYRPYSGPDYSEHAPDPQD